MDLGDFVYVLIGVVWLIYSFLKKGDKKKTSGLSGDEVIEQPVDEYLPSDLSHLSSEQAGTEGREVVEQVVGPYETARKEKLVMSKPGLQAGRAEPNEGRELERAKEKLAAALSFSSSSPMPHRVHNLSAEREEPPRPTHTKKPYKESYMGNLKGAIRTRAHPLTLGQISSEEGEELEWGTPDFDLRKAIIFSEILKRPEYFCR